MSNHRSRLRLVPWVLLAASLVVNGALFGRTRERPDPLRGAGAPKEISTAGSEDGCEARLARLLAAERARLVRDLGWLVGGAAREARAARAAREAHEAHEAQAPGGEKSNDAWREEEDQEDALCRVAKRHLRQHWVGQREALTKSLRRSLGDEEEQARDLAKESRLLARAAGLDTAGQAVLEARYAPLRQARLAAVRAALEQDPAAFDVVLDEVFGLFGDEDRLVAAQGGAGALRLLREARREERTVIAALAAALADVPWDGSIVW